MARLPAILGRARAVPWLTVLEALRRIKACYDALTPRERAEVRELARRARERRGRLSERDRQRIVALGGKCLEGARRR
jgi:hypothetical protein